MKPTPPTTSIAFVCLISVFAIGCGGSGTGGGGGGTGTPTPTPTASPSPSPTPTPVPPGSSTTVVIGNPGLCDPGDVARVDLDQGGKLRFKLVNDSAPCTPAKDNRKEEYTLILYNTTAAPISYRIDSNIDPTEPAILSGTLLNSASAYDDPLDKPVKPPQSDYNYKTGPTDTDFMSSMMVQAARLSKTPLKYTRRAAPSNRAVSSSVSVGSEAEFRVRCDRADPDVFCTTSGILRGQGTNINVWVDRDLPFDVAGNPDSLTTANVADIITIFQNNTYDLETNLLGSPSDVDGDSRVNIVITPIVNRYIKAAAFTDTRDLLPYNGTSNPGSNEGEFIYIMAPDSQDNFLAENGRPDSVPPYNAAQFMNRFVNGWIAFELAHLISYNQHVFVSAGAAEDDWINDGIGALMADLAGFNIWRFAGVDFFLSQPQLDDLRKADEFGDVDEEGAEYMFMLYYLQSQVDGTIADADGDGFDDDLDVLGTLMTSSQTGVTNLEDAVDFTFDSTIETEFQAIFKDWMVALATSGSGRTDLQNTTQTAIQYYFGLNPTQYGTGISLGAGSVRTGANGVAPDTNATANTIGIDLNLYHTEDFTLVENTDEHVWSPGNTFYGYVDPFAGMYVRLGGLFQQEQTISIVSSSGQLQGFVIRRTDVTYPHVYSESIFGTADQSAEDLDTAGPNPYWTGQGIAKKVDLTCLIDDTSCTSGTPVVTADNGVSKDWLSIVGRLDEPNFVRVCSAKLSDCDNNFVSVPDTDKYIFTVPDIAGRAVDDEGQLAFYIRRQFEEGSDEAGFEPMLAIVSSKDVPYPFVPHPIRGQAQAGVDAGFAATLNTLDTRQQYRWFTPQMICGDGDATDLTNIAGVPCPAATEPADIGHLVYTGLAEPTATIQDSAPGNWDGDLEGGECDINPNALPTASRPAQVIPAGYGAHGMFDVTTTELSPSSLGGYTWVSFMTYDFDGFIVPDVIFDREFLKPVSGYPSDDPKTMYDPRTVNGITINCNQNNGTGTTSDKTPDNSDDFLEPGELTRPGTLVEQILTEMSRGRFWADGTDTVDEVTALAASASQFDDFDVLALDGDSRDDDTACSSGDSGNNINTFTVRSGEGSAIWADVSFLEPHVAGNLENSAFTTANDGGTPLGLPGVVGGQKLYRPNPAAPLSPFITSEGTGTAVVLTPGKSYTLIVGGSGTGNYELRIRKIDSGVADATGGINLHSKVFVDRTIECKFDL